MYLIMAKGRRLPSQAHCHFGIPCIYCIYLINSNFCDYLSHILIHKLFHSYTKGSKPNSYHFALFLTLHGYLPHLRPRPHFNLFSNFPFSGLRSYLRLRGTLFPSSHLPRSRGILVTLKDPSPNIFRTRIL